MQALQILHVIVTHTQEVQDHMHVTARLTSITAAMSDGGSNAGRCWPQVFFCKYNDPIYVKMEKLEIMIKLASDKNIDQVLLEFKEYATEVDVDFVRKVSCVVNA